MGNDWVMRREKTSIWEKKADSLSSQRSAARDDEWRIRVNKTEQEARAYQDQSVLSNLKFQPLPSWF